MSNKRERSTNWEKEEKQLLRDILRPYLCIIENKDLSTNTNKAKMKAWTEITEKFNTANTRTREKKQLMNQWKCTKLHSKKEFSLYRQDLTKTGGGPKLQSPSPDVLEVVDMIPQEFEVDFNEFDCDGVKDVSKEKFEIQETYKSNINMNNKDIELNIVDDYEYLPHKETPGQSQVKTTPTRSAKKTPVSKNKHSFNFAEASFADMQSFRVLENERLQREHELRMKNMSELHSQVMTNLKLQQEILVKTLESFNK